MKRKEDLKRREGSQKHNTEELATREFKITKINKSKISIKRNMTTKNPKEKDFQTERKRRNNQIYLMSYLYITHRIVAYLML